MKVFTVAHVPNDLAHAWLQHLRDFDTAHPGCHFEVMADAPNVALAEVVQMTVLNPELTVTEVLSRAKP